MTTSYAAYTDHYKIPDVLYVGQKPKLKKSFIAANERAIPSLMIKENIIRVIKCGPIKNWDGNSVTITNKVWWQLNGEVFSTDIGTIEELPNNTDVLWVLPGYGDGILKATTVHCLGSDFMIQTGNRHTKVHWSWIIPQNPKAFPEIFKDVTPKSSHRRVG